MSLQEFIPTPKFEEYKELFKDHYKLDRRPDGVLLVQAHTQGGPIQLSVQNHRSLGQLFKTIGQDPENELVIFTGSGDDFMMTADPTGFELEEQDPQYWAYEYAFKDCRINITSPIFDIDVPTIGLLNGPGLHTEICLMCDITLCAEHAVIFDPHYEAGWVPGDGINLCFRELMGTKRAAFALLTSQAIDAKTALEWGMVNEVLPREKLIERAYEIADQIMKQHRTMRRCSTAVVRRPWKERVTNDLDTGIGIQMFSYLAKKSARHTKEHFDSVNTTKVPKKKG
jgi:enoyl-CoA hydratase/carnithine racemase